VFCRPAPRRGSKSGAPHSRRDYCRFSISYSHDIYLDIHRCGMEHVRSKTFRSTSEQKLMYAAADVSMHSRIRRLAERAEMDVDGWTDDDVQPPAQHRPPTPVATGDCGVGGFLPLRIESRALQGVSYPSKVSRQMLPGAWRKIRRYLHTHSICIEYEVRRKNGGRPVASSCGCWVGKRGGGKG